MITGTIKNFFADRGFGFLKSLELPTDTFFHISAVALEQQGDVRAGLRVKFDIERAPDGRDRARRVELFDDE
jgi:cold shock CspA family protein